MDKILHKLFRIDSKFWDYYKPIAAFCSRNEEPITFIAWSVTALLAWAMGSWVIGHLLY